MIIPILALVIANLSPCPNSPNCVNSQATDSRHAIEPFPVYENAEKDLQLIKAIIKALPRTKIIKQSPNYISVEFTTKFFRFTDDIEFLINRKKNVIDVRSASRVGYSDLGVNRKRIESIRKEYLYRQEKKKAIAN